MLPRRVIPICGTKGRNRARVSEGATPRWGPCRNAFARAAFAAALTLRLPGINLFAAGQLTFPSRRRALRDAGLRPQDLTENSVLLGSPAQITDVLKRVENAGFAEVILYFNVGLKPHPQVKDEMARFMAEVAPAFA